MEAILEFLLPALIAFFITVFCVPLMIKLSRKLHLIDDPKTHKHPAILHTVPIPRGGGLPMYIALVISTIIFIPLEFSIIMILFGGLLAVIIGVFDDRYDMSPYHRFFSNFFVAIMPVLGGITIFFIANPLGTGVIPFNTIVFPFGFFGKDTILLPGDLIAIIWIIWTMNMLNWSTGVNGQMPGVAAIAAITIGFLSLRFSPLDQTSLITAKLSFITAGVVLGFLPYNFPNARIFPGYSGTVIGYMLAVLSILSGAKVATAILVMAVPTIDALFTILRRISAGRSPFRGDRGHFHHLLLQKGWSVTQIVFFYWVLSAILGILALSLTSIQKFFTIIIVGIAVGGYLLWLSLFAEKTEDKSTKG